MKLIYTLVAGFILTASFGQGKDISINGTLLNAEGKTIYLQNFVGNQMVKLDSATLNKKGKFKFNVNAQEPKFYSLFVDRDNYSLIILDEKSTDSKMTFSADLNRFLPSIEITGSSQSSEVATFSGSVFNHKVVKDSLNKKLYQKGVTLDEKQQLQKDIAANDMSLIKTRNDFIQRNKSSIASITALSFLNLREEGDIQLFRDIEKGLSKSVPNSEYYKSVKAQLVQIETQLEIQKEQEEKRKAQEARTAVGAVAPELNFKNPQGEVITLESLRGNYVLIDFWASWCRPCRMENPNVVKSYNKYKDKGFTVYSVSLDKDPARWQNAIIQDGLVWPNHVSDLKQWQTEATKIYGFNGIPFTVLIDPEGKIIAKNLRGPALENKLEELLGS